MSEADGRCRTLFGIFGVFAGVAVVSSVLVLLIRPIYTESSRVGMGN
jgi:hypothetical protein